MPNVKRNVTKYQKGGKLPKLRFDACRRKAEASGAEDPSGVCRAKLARKGK